MLEVFLLTLSSLVLYHIGVGVGVFLIPLQMVASRRGEGPLAAACGGFLLVFLALRFLPFLGGALPDVMTVLETIFIVVLLLGILVVNVPAGGWRTLYRMLGATAVVGCAAVPVGIWLARRPQFQAAMGALFADVSRALTALFAGREGTTDPALAALLSPETLRRISDAYVTRSLLASYFLLLSFSWWAGQLSATGSSFRGRRRFHFADFRLEGFWLWPLIAAGVLILADLFLGVRGAGGPLAQAQNAASPSGTVFGGAWVSWFAYAGWNVGLVLLILYGLQGLAILRFLFERHGLPRFLWFLLLIGLVGLAASPRAGLFVMLVVPAFGISENWVHYRVVARGEPNESQ